MIVKYSAFIAPHGGERFSNCQDRFMINGDTHSFAVADGVTHSLCPAQWAEIVCKYFVLNPNIFINEHSGKWNDQDKAIIEYQNVIHEMEKNLSENERFIFEMQKEKHDYAACTFVGLHIDADKWVATTIGDSCLVVVQKNNIIDVIPQIKAGDFGNYPDYFASNSNNNGIVNIVKHNIETVDSFLIMTDALAEWLLSPNRGLRLEKLMSIKSHEDFIQLIESERDNHSLKDDDSTLLRIDILPESSNQVVFHDEHVDDIKQLEKSDITIKPIEEDDEDKRKKKKLSTNTPKANNSDSVLEEAAALIRKFKSVGSRSLSTAEIDNSLSILEKLVMRLKYSSGSLGISSYQNTIKLLNQEIIKKDEELTKKDKRIKELEIELDIREGRAMRLTDLDYSVKKNSIQ